jgi:hypothetical protein
VVDVGLAGEELVDGFQVITQFAVPAAVGGVDEVGGRKIPDLAVPVFVEGVGLQRIEERGGANRFGGGPPDLVGKGRAIVEAQGLEEAALLSVPAADHGAAEEPLRCIDVPDLPTSVEDPELGHETCPLEPMAGRGAGGAEHIGTLV